jgi:hypothetical protein
MRHRSRRRISRRALIPFTPQRRRDDEPYPIDEGFVTTRDDAGARAGQLALALPPEKLERRDGATRGPEPAPSARIYVNRNLRLDAIAWVGFDMDYTLARYRQEEMDRLSIAATVKKMVEKGRPASLLEASFDASFPIRGVHVDRKLGHVDVEERQPHLDWHGQRRQVGDPQPVAHAPVASQVPQQRLEVTRRRRGGGQQAAQWRELRRHHMKR